MRKINKDSKSINIICKEIRLTRLYIKEKIVCIIIISGILCCRIVVREVFDFSKRSPKAKY